ncbi:MAG: hypothetical protein AAGI69_30730 [Cyanobacteria bacterium P01_H01_bin.21]
MVVVFIFASMSLPMSSWAAELQGSQQIEQVATLVGPRAKAPIPIYLRPAPNQPNVGYGINGDVVTVMERLASFLPEADESSDWNHIRLEHEPYTEGWVQGKFLLMEKSDTREYEESSYW